MSLSSLQDGYRAAVFGAAGGIGAALVRRLVGDPRCAQVYAGARRAVPAAGKITPFGFDLEDEASIAAAAQGAGAKGPLDLVLVATGLLHGAGLAPEKTMRALAPEALLTSYRVNAIGPALIAKYCLPLLPRDRKSVFGALSARVGSIADNASGGWHGYRASKAALNQLIRTCAIELKVRNTLAVCVTLHPGTVDTGLSAPFKAGVAADKLFAPDQSAAYLLGVVDGLTAADSGGLFAWDGAKIAF